MVENTDIAAGESGAPVLRFETCVGLVTCLHRLRAALHWILRQEGLGQPQRQVVRKYIAQADAVLLDAASQGFAIREKLEAVIREEPDRLLAALLEQRSGKAGGQGETEQTEGEGK